MSRWKRQVIPKPEIFRDFIEAAEIIKNMSATKRLNEAELWNRMQYDPNPVICAWLESLARHDTTVKEWSE